MTHKYQIRQQVKLHQPGYFDDRTASGGAFALSELVPITLQKRAVLMGESQGGWIAPLAAVRAKRERARVYWGDETGLRGAIGTPDQLREGSAAMLVQYLDHVDLDFRVLSASNLQEIVGSSLRYRLRHPGGPCRPQGPSPPAARPAGKAGCAATAHPRRRRWPWSHRCRARGSAPPSA
mgnify:CR=1 FL=1